MCEGKKLRMHTKNFECVRIPCKRTISCSDSDSPMTVTGGCEVTCDRLVNIIAARLNFSPLTAPLFALYQVS